MTHLLIPEDQLRALDALMDKWKNNPGPHMSIEQWQVAIACADELTAILASAKRVDDALHGDFAECYLTKNHLQSLRDPEIGLAVVSRAKDGNFNIPLFINPAKRVEVDDAMVERACVAQFACWDRLHQHEREGFRKEVRNGIKAALGEGEGE